MASADDLESIRQPTRTCVGCRRRGPQSSFVRLVYIDGHLVEGRTLPGRGAYLCLPPGDCARRAAKRLPHALKQPVNPSTIAELTQRWASQVVRSGPDVRD
jgi:uncharacterized protein